MNQRSTDFGVAARAAMLASAAMIGQQVAGKAARDAMFLSSFGVTALPTMLIASSLFSILFALLAARAMSAAGPSRLVPAAFAASAALLLAEWGMASRAPELAAIAVYLHMATFGPMLVSGFWSLVNERFDPRTAKREFGRIGGVSALGGLAGGILAERVAASFTVTAMLPVMAAMHVYCAWAVRALRPRIPADRAAAAPGRATPGSAESRPADLTTGLRMLAAVPYLRNLVMLVVTGAIGAALVDYVFKANATASFRRGEELMRLFSVFYMGVALLTFMVQAGLSRVSLERLGLARTVATLPSALAAAATGALLAPGLVASAVARGAEAVLRNSLFRSAYEVLFTPIPPEEKRATKTIVDVGFDRVGDALGGGLVALLLLLGPARANAALLAAAIALSVVGVAVALQLHRGYVAALEKSLLRGAVALDPAQLQDSTTRSALLRTMGSVDLSRTTLGLRGKPGPAGAAGAPQAAAGTRGVGAGLAGASAARAVSPASNPAAGAAVLDPVLARIADLRSAEPARIRAVLADEARLGPALVPHIVPLLAFDEVAPHAVLALRSFAPKATGQLVDALLDPAHDPAVRRRLARVLVAGDTVRAVEGLLKGLADERFEVRFQCGRALARLRDRHAGLTIPGEAVIGAVLREVAVEKRVWEAQGQLDRLEEKSDSPFVDEFLRKRANRSLEHVFTLLSLSLPREPLKVAFQGLLTDDAILRGMALEYLESVLPAEVREKLWPFLEDRRSPARPARPREEILADLLRSNQSIELNLAELRKLQEGS